MKSANPPRMAAWILQHFGPQTNNDVLAGDLSEGFQQGRSSGWYWRQVLAAVRWRRLLSALLASAVVGWAMSSRLNQPGVLIDRSLDMSMITVMFFVGIILPPIRIRVRLALALLILLSLYLFHRYNPGLAGHYSLIILILVNNLVLSGVRSKNETAASKLSWRELVMGDPFAEKKRMLTKLEQLMSEEADPELRKTYERAIIALHSGESNVATIAKEMQ